VLPGKLVRYTGAIYSVLLEKDGVIDAQVIELGNGSDEVLPFWGVTLGHGIVEERGRNDTRAHRFFGSYDKIVRSLNSLRKGRDGLVIGGGVRRSKSLGLVVGFKAYRPRRQTAVSLLLSAYKDVVKRRRHVVHPGQKRCKAVVY
jgi:hypothetical protein